MTHDEVQAWLDAYVAAWRSYDRSEIGALYADDATYEVLLVRSRHDTSPAAAANIVCAVNLANERTITLDGSRQATSTDAANTATIGTFDAVAGLTAVTCDADGGHDSRP